jgi:hypothetical protein
MNTLCSYALLEPYNQWHSHIPKQLNTRLSSPPHMGYMPYPSHSSQLYHSHNSGWGVQIINLLIMQFLYSPLTSSFLGPNILLNTLFSNTLSLRSSLNVSDQVSHPYKATVEIIKLFYLGPFHIILFSKACRNGLFCRSMVEAETTVGDMTFLQRH